MTLETKRLRLRPWQDADLPVLYRLCSDPLVMRYFERALNLDEVKSFLERLNKHQEEYGFCFWAAEMRETGSVAGIIGMQWAKLYMPFLTVRSPRPLEIGWRLLPEFWHKGLASEGAFALVDFAFDQVKEDRVIACTALHNQASRRVMERIGMRYCAGGDFDHPDVTPDHPLCRHALYELRREDRRRPIACFC